MKRKISLVLAIIMIVTTVISAMPAMTLTAFAEETPEVTVYKTADGSKVADYATFAEAVAAVKDMTGDLTLKFNKDITGPSGYNVEFSGERTITIDGNGYSIATNATYAFDTADGAKTSLVIQNINIYHQLGTTGNGNAIRSRSISGGVTVKNANIYSCSAWGSINMLGKVGSVFSLVIENSNLVDVPKENTGAIRLGNSGQAKTINITIRNSNIAGKGVVSGHTANTTTLNIENSVLTSYKNNAFVDFKETPTFTNVVYDVPSGKALGVTADGATAGVGNFEINSFKALQHAKTFTDNLPAAGNAYNIIVTGDITNSSAPTVEFLNVRDINIKGADKYTINLSGSSNLLRINKTGAVTFENLDFILKTTGGCAFQVADNGKKLNLKSITADILESKWSAINLNGQDVVFTMEDSYVISRTCATYGLLQTGNPNTKPVKATISGSTLVNLDGKNLISITGGGKIADIDLINCTLAANSGAIANVASGASATTTLDIDKNCVVASHNNTLINNPDAIAGIKNNAKGFAKIGDTEYYSWTALCADANAAAADVEVKLIADTYALAENGIKFENANAKITIDGDGHTINAVAKNPITFNGNVDLKNATYEFTGASNGIIIGKAGSNINVTNVDINVHNSTAKAWSAITCFGQAGTTSDAITLKLEGVNIVMNDNYGTNNADTGAIRFGNGAENVNFTMVDSTIDVANDSNRHGIYSGAAAGTILVIASEITTSADANAAKLGANITATTVVESELNTEVNGGAANEKVNSKVEMDKGASVRINTGSNGIRFTATISAETIGNIMKIADEGSVKYGTLVTVKEAVDANGGIFDAEAIRALSWKVMDIKGVIDNGVTVNAPAEGKTYGDVNIRAAIVNIKDSHIKTEYAAIAYVEYTVNGITCYAYSEYDAANTRSMYAIAQAALADVGPQSSTYVYPMGDGTYSPYTTAQRDVLQSYIAKGDALAG